MRIWLIPFVFNFIAAEYSLDIEVCDHSNLWEKEIFEDDEHFRVVDNCTVKSTKALDPLKVIIDSCSSNEIQMTIPSFESHTTLCIHLDHPRIFTCISQIDSNTTQHYLFQYSPLLSEDIRVYLSCDDRINSSLILIANGDRSRIVQKRNIKDLFSYAYYGWTSCLIVLTIATLIIIIFNKEIVLAPNNSLRNSSSAQHSATTKPLNPTSIATPPNNLIKQTNISNTPTPQPQKVAVVNNVTDAMNKIMTSIRKISMKSYKKTQTVKDSERKVDMSVADTARLARNSQMKRFEEKEEKPLQEETAPEPESDPKGEKEEKQEQRSKKEEKKEKNDRKSSPPEQTPQKEKSAIKVVQEDKEEDKRSLKVTQREELVKSARGKGGLIDLKPKSKMERKLKVKGSSNREKQSKLERGSKMGKK